MTGSNTRSGLIQARVRDAGTESGVENSFTRLQESNPLPSFVVQTAEQATCGAGNACPACMKGIFGASDTAQRLCRSGKAPSLSSRMCRQGMVSCSCTS